MSLHDFLQKRCSLCVMTACHYNAQVVQIELAKLATPILAIHLSKKILSFLRLSSFSLKEFCCTSSNSDKEQQLFLLCKNPISASDNPLSTKYYIASSSLK
jgi:hypothetical protein